MKKFLSLFILYNMLCSFVYADTSINIGNVIKGNKDNTIENNVVNVINPVTVSFDIGGSSKELKTDNTLPITIVKSTVINGVKYNSGGKGFLTLGRVERSRNLGKGGIIIISNGKINDANGNEHICEYSETIKGEDNNTVKILTVVGIFCLPLLLSALKNGKEATIQKGNIVQVSIVE